MPLRFGINGLGRVGRALLRASRGVPGIELAAVHDVVPAAQLARLVARDTVEERVLALQEHKRRIAAAALDGADAAARLTREDLLMLLAD